MFSHHYGFLEEPSNWEIFYYYLMQIRYYGFLNFYPEFTGGHGFLIGIGKIATYLAFAASLFIPVLGFFPRVGLAIFGFALMVTDAVERYITMDKWNDVWQFATSDQGKTIWVEGERVTFPIPFFILGFLMIIFSLSLGFGGNKKEKKKPAQKTTKSKAS